MIHPSVVSDVFPIAFIDFLFVVLFRFEFTEITIRVYLRTCNIYSPMYIVSSFPWLWHRGLYFDCNITVFVVFDNKTGD